MILFISFGLFAPPNRTVIATLIVCALSVSDAIFLILELAGPFDGLIQISSAPLRNAFDTSWAVISPLEAVHGHCPFIVALLLSTQLPSRHGSANNRSVRSARELELVTFGI